VKASVRRTIAFVTLVSALGSVLFAGRSYFVCPWMQRAAASCCCPAPRSTHQGPSVSRPPCCDQNTLAAANGAPTDPLRPTTDVPAATAFSGELIPVADGVALVSPIARSQRAPGARYGPPSPLFELHSSYLI
jgi:hypothetical protein